ncbi:hypothetical protein OOT46_00935 [Aquabacterium sp. A7-Y]|uniref:hypothetical protein n=1 Tax=Aquabacterium sp. A7-Y TaxID=1349605 RepID=UPI00223D9463|nr:hypothetical protein [Aquabacterium sp. A7-Y]MCW7536419.1 hypothetical protein [Aquabacterium sp. A7-Y]
MTALSHPSLATPALAAPPGSFKPASTNADNMNSGARYRLLRTFLVAALAASGALMAPQGGHAQEADLARPQAAAKSKVGGTITRSEVISRAMYWVNRHVPYSMSKYHRDPQGKRYRTDCSGMVSMGVHLPRSETTRSLPGDLRRIGRGSLRKGDVVGTLGTPNGSRYNHVVIFNGWANAARTKIHTLEQRGGHGAIKHIRAVNYKVGNRYAKPYRYKKIAAAAQVS